jgi:adenylate cyclase
VSIEISKKVKVNFFIGLTCTALLVVLMLIDLSPIKNLEEKVYDLRFKIRGAVKPSGSIVIAAIDEKSIERFGRWPWSRDKIARLIEKLSVDGAELIVFDAFFSEKERYDIVLGNAIRDAGNVLLPIVFDFNRITSTKEDQLLISTSFHSINNLERLSRYAPIRAKGILVPVPELLKDVMTLGHINMIPDDDGILRMEPMIIEYKGYLYPSIDVQAAAIYLGIPHEKIIVKATEGIQLGEKRYIPTDRHGMSLIYYYGPMQTFRHVSISDIMEGNIKPGLLQGKIVIVGATAMGIYDLRVTPFSPVMPGVEKHANVIASILDNKFLRRVSRFTDLGILLVSGFLFSLLVGRFKIKGAFGLATIFILSIFSVGYYLFDKSGLWINITYPTLNTFLILTSITAYNYAIEERYARRIRAMFSSYVTERVVNELIRNPDMARLGGERREVTVLFSDVRGFTAFSEKNTPEDVVAILNEYLGAMTEVIFRWEGTLDKFIGDAIMAFWGAPMKQENHAELAVKCALNMAKRLEELKQKWQSEGKPILDAGIGINTGEVLVGNIGAEGKKMDYTVIGDHVNLGSRVEALTRTYNADILITEFTYNKVTDSIRTGRIGHMESTALEKVVVKGKEKAIVIYEIRSIEPDAKSGIGEPEDGNVMR